MSLAFTDLLMLALFATHLNQKTILIAQFCFVVRQQCLFSRQILVLVWWQSSQKSDHQYWSVHMSYWSSLLLLLLELDPTTEFCGGDAFPFNQIPQIFTLDIQQRCSLLSSKHFKLAAARSLDCSQSLCHKLIDLLDAPEMLNQSTEIIA